VFNDPHHGNASAHYSLLWWNNGDGTIPACPRDAFWSWGLYDSLILVVPSLDLVAARAGQGWKRTSDEHYDVLKPFFEPLARRRAPARAATARHQAGGSAVSAEPGDQGNHLGAARERSSGMRRAATTGR
jgi:hypothetical protein